MFESNLLTVLKTGVFAFVTLFPIVNPLGDAPIFLKLTHGYPQDVQTLLARKVAFYGFLLLAGSMVLGTAMLRFFGVSVSAIQLAGGLVLASTGWQLLSAGQEDDASKHPMTADAAMESAFYPLTLPLTVGPGCISVSITIGAHLRQLAGNEYLFRLPLFLSALGGMFVLCAMVWFCYGNARRLVKILGPTGTTIVMRLSSFILVAIGVQIMLNGLTVAVKSWLH
jgi:multiple antibiotic resistance protein